MSGFAPAGGGGAGAFYSRLTFGENGQDIYNDTFDISNPASRSWVGGSKGTRNTLSGIGATASLWGQPIPVTWGKVKLTPALLEMGSVKMRVQQVGYQSQRTANGLVWGFDYATYATCNFVLSLGYQGNASQQRFINRVWLDGKIAFQANAPSAMQQQMAFFPASETRGVVDALKASSTDPLTYRGLMFMVLFDVNVMAPGTAGRLNRVPNVEVELFEYAVSSTPRTTLTPLGTYSGPGVNNDRTFYDWETATLYTVDTSNIIHKWNVVSGREIDSYPILDYAGLPNWSPPGAGATCMVKVNGRVYMTAEQNVSNNRNYFVVIDLETGVITDRFGDGNMGVFFFNSYPTGAICNQVNHFPFVTGVAGAQRAFVWMSTNTQGNFVWEIKTDGKLRPVLWNDTWPRAVAINPRGVVDDAGNTSFVMTREDVSAVQSTDKITVTPDGKVTVTANLTAATGRTCIAQFATADNFVVLFESGGGGNQIRKVNPQTGEVISSLTGGAVPPFPITSRLWAQSNTQGRSIGWLSIAGVTYYLLDMISMSVTSWPITGSPPVTGQPAYDALDNKFYDASSTAVAQISVSPVDTTRVSLSTILTDLCVRSGYAPADVIIENIPDLVTGGIISAAFNLRQTLLDLGAVYRFRLLERDGKIVLTRRARGATFGGADWTVLEEDRCVIDNADGANVTIQTARVTDTKVPSRVSLEFIDEGYNYAPNVYTYTRPDGTSGSSAAASYSIPIVMTMAEAASLVTRMTYDGWSSRIEHRFRLPQRFLAMEPGDVVSLVRDGFIDLCEVQELTVNGDFSIDVVVVTITTEDGVTVTAGELTNQIVEEPVLYGDGRGEPLVVDTTPIVAGNSYLDTRSPVYYAVINAGRGAWPGANVQFSPGNGVDFSTIGSSLAEATTGRVFSALPTNPSFGIDRTAGADILVRFFTGSTDDLASVTTLEMLAGANRVLIGAPGRWELIGFETATENVDGTWTLSGILRGMRGTDIFVNQHLASDTVILVQGALGQPFLHVSDYALVGETVTVAAAYDDAALRTSPRISFAFNGNGRKPFAPVQPKAVLGVANLITLTWNRRARSDDTMIDETADQPLDETAETYDLEILNAGGSAVVRTLTGLTSPTYAYSAADQTTDGFTPPMATINVRIYQVSSVAGRGFAREATLNVQ